MHPNCPKCGKELVLELLIGDSDSLNRYICSCGYTKLYDPFNTRSRRITTEFYTIFLKES